MEVGRNAPLNGPDARNTGTQSQNQRISWRPNKECLQSLMAMGIERSVAIKGLYYTGNHSAEFAASYIFDHPDLDEDLDQCIRIEYDDLQDESLTERVQETYDSSAEVPHYKMVFVVNCSLGMDCGKTAAQVGHAAVGLFRRLNNEEKSWASELNVWEEEGEKKVILKGLDAPHLRILENQANGLDLPTCLIQDAGLTDVPPGSVTVLGIFGREEAVNSLTGKLFLL